ncbi:protein PET117 homolog, mitochondrial [Geothlypis trichas]
MQFGISGRRERRTGGLHLTKPEMFLARIKKFHLFALAGRNLQGTAPGDGGTAGHPIPSGAEGTKARFLGFLASRVRVYHPWQGSWPTGCEFSTHGRVSARSRSGISRQPLPPPRPASALGCSGLARCARRSAGAGRAASRSPAPPSARPALPPPRPRAAPPAMSRGSRLALAVSALFSAAIVAAVHIQQRQELERLRSGVVRDLERQNRKKENVRLLEEQIALTERLTEERDKALMEQRSQQP